MADTPLPRSNFGTASLVERRDQIPPVELDVEEGPGAMVPVDGEAIIEAPGLSIEMEDDGGVIVDFDPRATAQEPGEFHDNLGLGRHLRKRFGASWFQVSGADGAFPWRNGCYASFTGGSCHTISSAGFWRTFPFGRSG